MRNSARVRANRLNAKLSTGPHSIAGKEKVARNALRHGLAGARLDSPDKELLEAIKKSLGNDWPASAISSLAVSILDVARVRKVRTSIFAHMTDGDLADGIQTLERLQRYEQRASAKFRMSVAAFD